MKYILKNKTTGQETLCDKVTIDGTDYYVSDDTPPKSYEGYYFAHGKIFHTSETLLQTGCKKVIATENQSSNIPKVIPEVGKAWEEVANGYKHAKHGVNPYAFREGYNKAKERYKWTDEDLKGIFKIGQSVKAFGDYKQYTFEEAVELWKEQKPKTIWYE